MKIQPIIIALLLIVVNSEAKTSTSKNAPLVTTKYQILSTDTSNYEVNDFTSRLNYSISYSVLNHFQIKPIGEFSESNYSFEGFSGSLEYFINEKNFLSFTLGAAGYNREEGDNGISDDRLIENVQVYSFSVVRNFVKGRFSYGLGGTAASYYWSVDEFNNNNNNNELITSTSNTGSLGVVVNGYFNIWQQFHVGIVY
ncbi:MAG: hypothetical protein AB8F74_23270, partial [Saprospiraceae bacterium]